jgi:hypothetical protein
MLLLCVALPGCALDTFGTGPEVIAEVIRDAAPPPEADPPKAGAKSDAEVPALPDAAPEHPDVSASNIFGRPANPEAFKACQMNCLTGCCDPSGNCFTAPTDGACGVGGSVCSDCTAYASHCMAGICQ